MVVVAENAGEDARSVEVELGRPAPAGNGAAALTVAWGDGSVEPADGGWRLALPGRSGLVLADR